MSEGWMVEIPGRSVAACLDCLRHGGALEGADRIGEAWDEGRVVRIALFGHAGKPPVRARWKASTCATLMAYAEIACEAIEAGRDPRTVDAAFLRAHLAGVHPGHRDRADLVARALARALAAKLAFDSRNQAQTQEPRP